MVVHYSTVILGVVGGFIITIVGLAICITCRVRHKEEERRRHALKQDGRHTSTGNAIEMTTLLNPTSGGTSSSPVTPRVNRDPREAPEMNHVGAQRLANHHVTQLPQPNGDPRGARSRDATGTTYTKYPDVSNYSDEEANPVSLPVNKEKVQVTMERPSRSPTKLNPFTSDGKNPRASPRPDIIHSTDRPNVIRQRSWDNPRERQDRPNRDLRAVDDMDGRYPSYPSDYHPVDTAVASNRDPRDPYYSQQQQHPPQHHPSQQYPPKNPREYTRSPPAVRDYPPNEGYAREPIYTSNPRTPVSPRARSPVSPKHRQEFVNPGRSTDRLLYPDYERPGANYARARTPENQIANPRERLDYHPGYPQHMPPQGYDDMYIYHDNHGHPHYHNPPLERHQSLETIMSDKSEIWQPQPLQTQPHAKSQTLASQQPINKSQTLPNNKSFDAQSWTEPKSSVSSPRNQPAYRRTSSGGTLNKQGMKSPEIFYSRPSRGTRQHHPV